jgi:hypothetical protein
MAAYNKFENFVEDLGKGVHDLANDTLKVMLSNVAPSATNTVKSQITDIADGDGYTAGGAAVTNTFTESGGTAIAGATNVVWTSSGTIGPFRYVVLYNDTPTSPVKPLIGWWDNTTSVTLNSGDTFTVDFGSNRLFTIT